MKQAGVPIDPEMIVEKATTSRTDRERLRKYAREASQAAAMAADREAKTFEGQTRGMLMIEGMKAQEAARHNQRQEELTSDKQQKDAAMRLLDIWEKADDNEKALMFSTLQLAHQNDMAKRQEVSA
jgi:hypothetical protein